MSALGSTRLSGVRAVVGLALTVVLPLVLLVANPAARACGCGVPAGVSEPTDRSADRLSWGVSAAWGQLLTDISIGGADARLHHSALVATGSLRIPPGVTVSLSLGGVLDGFLHSRRRTWLIDPGFLMSVKASWRAVDNDGGIPFVDITAATAIVATHTRRAGNPREAFTALDIRAGVNVGWTLGEVFSPYVGARAFGGPIFWRRDGEDVFGTDRYHVQLAIGSTLALPKGFSVFVDWSFLGERSAWVGGGWHW